MATHKLLHVTASMGTQQLQDMAIPPCAKMDYVTKGARTRGKPCCNCGRIHKYRECPAYNSECNFCGKMGHWKECCRKARAGAEPPADNPVPKGKSGYRAKQRPQRQRRMNAVETYQATNTGDESADSDTEFTENFCSVRMSSKCLDSTRVRDEAFTTITVSCPGIRGTREMRLKLDIGAQGNTLPIRTFKQMYGEADPKKVLEPIGRTRLTSYSGDNIKCIDKLSVWCKYGTTKWKRAMFYVVDVPGPIVLGLPMCEALDLVTINCHIEALVAKPL